MSDFVWSIVDGKYKKVYVDSTDPDFCKRSCEGKLKAFDNIIANVEEDISSLATVIIDSGNDPEENEAYNRLQERRLIVIAQRAEVQAEYDAL